MTKRNASTNPGRRRLITAMPGVAALLASGASLARPHVRGAMGHDKGVHAGTEAFFGKHQNGLVGPNPQQANMYFAALDINTTRRHELIELLRRWTTMAERMTRGRKAVAGSFANHQVDPDTWDTLGLAPARLTVSFGFGPDLFTLKGMDRFGLARSRPAALVDLPYFPNDQMVKDECGGALAIQACSDDPQVAFHAVRELIRQADGKATLRWSQTGFSSAPDMKGVQRTLMGFKDGIMNPDPANDDAMNRHVWVGREGPDWLRGGTYQVYRRIRIDLKHWDRVSRYAQEQTFGRNKLNGAPLGAPHEFSPLDLNAVDKDGDPLIPQTAHVRLAAPSNNGGAQILRRSFNYADKAAMIAERWPPWHQEMRVDAGLLFIACQKDPRTGFIRLFEKMSRLDNLMQFTTHTASAIFAYPGGVSRGEYIGQKLFEAA